jgi:hypothetical protein
LIILKHSSSIGALVKKMESFLALQISHNIACHTINSPLNPYHAPPPNKIFPSPQKDLGKPEKLTQATLKLCTTINKQKSTFQINGLLILCDQWTLCTIWL